MGIVRLHGDGRVEVIRENTPEEDAAAEQGLLRLVAALARMAARQDYAEQAAALAKASGTPVGAARRQEETPAG